MRSGRSWLTASLLVLLTAAMFFTIGCTGPVGQANKINKDIHAKTDAIVKGATDASQHVEAADQKVVAASTQPANPPATTALLNGAHQDLGKAKADLAPIVPAATQINTKSDQAAAVTNKVASDLKKERDSFFSHKQKVLAAVLATILVLVAVGAFIVKTAGGGPIIEAVSEIVGDLIKAVKNGVTAVAKRVGSFVLHLLTLGSLKLADKVNQKYDEQQVKVQAGTEPARDVR